MKFTILYFGLLAERRGLSMENIVSFASTPAEIYAELDAMHALDLSIADFRVAVNDEFVPWSHALAENDTVAMLPPMSGG